MPASRLQKTILKVGTYESPDGTVIVTPARLKHWAANHAKLLSAQQVVPVHWDHSEDEKKTIPLPKTEFSDPRKRKSAKDTVGHMPGFKLSPDGKSAEITVDLHRKSAIESAGKNTVFVSPIIMPEWRDGSGNVYKDVITTCDLVDHPVDSSQTPFKAVEQGTIACAIRMGLGHTKSDKKKPLLYRFAEDYEEESDESDDEADDILEETTDDTPPPADTDTGDSDEAVKKAILADLEAVGIAAPEGVDPITDAKEFLQQLCAALRQKKMDEEGGMEDDLGEDDDLLPLEEEPMEVTSPGMAAMSLQANAAYSYAQKQHRMSLHARINALAKSGRCTPAEAKAKKASVDKVRLSLDPSSQEPKKFDVDKWIEDRESLPPGAAMPEIRLSLLSDAEVEYPQIETASADPAKIKQEVDEQTARHPGMFAKVK